MEIDLPDKLHPKGFWPWPARIGPGYPEPPSLGAGATRRVRKSAQCANHVQPLDETPAFWALLFIGRALVNIIAAMYLPCQITANRQHLPCSGKCTAKETGIWKL